MGIHVKHHEQENKTITALAHMHCILTLVESAVTVGARVKRKTCCVNCAQEKKKISNKCVNKAIIIVKINL
jgi:hypothetical protein